MRDWKSRASRAVAGFICFYIFFGITMVASSGGAETKKMRILAVGQVLPGECPVLDFLGTDPLVTYARVPTDVDVYGGRSVYGTATLLDLWKRMVRLYFPRTRSELVENYDFFLYPDTWLKPFTGQQIADMRYAVEKEGLGAFMTTGGDLASPNSKSWTGWRSSVMLDILPVEFSQAMTFDSGFRIKILKDDPPILSMFRELGLEKVNDGRHTWLEPRPGSSVWADMVTAEHSSTGSKAWMVSWKVGSTGGYYWMIADDIDHAWWSSTRNKYAMDVFMNVILYSTGRELPGDIIIIHGIRERYRVYSQYVSYLNSIIEFVEKFDANTARLVEEIDQIDETRLRSNEEYMEQRYDDAFQTIGAAIADMGGLEEKAIKLKDRALFWIYVVEWLAVMGTMMLCGTVVWTLMVRRRFYREIGTTRGR